MKAFEIDNFSHMTLKFELYAFYLLLVSTAKFEQSLYSSVTYNYSIVQVEHLNKEKWK